MPALNREAAHQKGRAAHLLPAPPLPLSQFLTGLLARPADRQHQLGWTASCRPPCRSRPGPRSPWSAVERSSRRRCPSGLTVILQPMLLPCSIRCAFRTVPPVTVKAWSPQGLVADTELLAEPHLEGEDALSVMRRRCVLDEGRERRERGGFHRIRGRAGRCLLITGVVCEGHREAYCLALVGVGQRVGFSRRPGNVGVVQPATDS